MKKAVVLPIVIIGSLLLITGSIIFAVGVSSNTKTKSVTNEYTINESFNNINVDFDITDLEIKAGEGDSKKLVFEETTYDQHSYKVEDGTLKLNYTNSRKWYQRWFNFTFKRVKATLYLPHATYGNLTIKNATGDIIVPKDYVFTTATIKLSTGNIDFRASVVEKLDVNVSTGNVNLNGVAAPEMNVVASTGNIRLEDVAVAKKVFLKTSTGHVTTKNLVAENLEIQTSTGDMTIANTIITKDITINTKTGDIKFDKSDAETIHIKTSTGDVTGTLLTPKTFYAKSHTGKVNVPHTTGGECTIDTDTGDIVITIAD